MIGALPEGWVIAEAGKVFMALWRKPVLYCWRSNAGLAVDLLIMINGKLQSIDIELAATPGALVAFPTVVASAPKLTQALMQLAPTAIN